MTIRITDVLDALRIPWVAGGEHPNVRHGATAGLNCPQCGSGSGAHGGYPMAIFGNFAATCWACGPQNLVRALSALSGAPAHEVAHLLLPLGDAPTVARIRATGKFILPAGAGELQRPHRRYLERRGIDPDAAAQTWGALGVGQHDRYSWRILLPTTAGGLPASWTARSIRDGEGVVRYLAAPPEEERLPLKSLLWGADLAERHGVGVVEGPLDAMAGGAGFAATCGVSTTAAQVLAIARFPLRLVIFDAEAGAQRRAQRLVRALACFPGRTIRVELETGKDLARADRREVREVRRLLT